MWCMSGSSRAPTLKVTTSRKLNDSMRSRLADLAASDIDETSVVANFDHEFRRLEGRIDRRLWRARVRRQVRAWVPGAAAASLNTPALEG